MNPNQTPRQAERPLPPPPLPNDSIPKSPLIDPVTVTDTPAKKSLRIPIILMAWPTVALIISIALYAVVNLIFASVTAPTSSDGDTVSLFASQHPINTIVNVLLFIIGGIAVTLGPISFIIGLILLIAQLGKK